MPLNDHILSSDQSSEARLRDIESRFALMVLDPSRNELTESISRRIAAARGLAQTNLSTVLDSGDLDQLPPADREGARLFVQSLDSLAGSIGGRERRWLDDAVDERCVSIERDSKEFWKSFESHLGRYGNVASRDMRQAFDKMRQGLQSSGTDCDVLLAEAQKEVWELSVDSDGASSPYVWLALGWLGMTGTASLDQAEQSLFKGMLLRNSPSEVVEVLLSRHLAYVHFLRKAPDAAFSAIQKAVGVRSDGESHLDAARYAAGCERPSEVRRNLDAAFAATPLACIDALADATIRAAWPPLLQALLAAQSLAHERLSKAWSGHHEALDRIRQAQARSGVPGGSAFAAIEDPTKSSLGLFQAESALHELVERRSETLEAARRTIGSALKEKREAAEVAQRRMDDAWNEREAAGNEAKAIHQAQADAARASASAGLPDAARLQQGCMWSLGIGCGGLALYSILVVLLGMAGMQIGPDTFFGKLAIGLALAPVAFAGILQLVVASKQSALQAEMWREVERSRLVMEAANQKVDASYRAKLPKLRDELAAAQAEVKRLEDAMETLE